MAIAENIENLLIMESNENNLPKKHKVDVFRDKNRISSFSDWGYEATKALFCCTHVILIVSENTLKGGTCRREMRRAFLRWNDELLPAMICVVMPEDRAKLLAAEETDLNLRFALFYCACISPEEAQIPGLLHSLIIERRRQGVWRDIMAMLLPDLTLELLSRKLYSKYSRG